MSIFEEAYGQTHAMLEKSHEPAPREEEQRENRVEFSIEHSTNLHSCTEMRKSPLYTNLVTYIRKPSPDEDSTG